MPNTRASLNPNIVLRRAADIADEFGLSAVTLSRVARSLSVQTPSLYSHMRDLAALHDGITALALDDLATRTADAVAGRAERDALAAFADAHRTFAQEHPGRWESLQRRAGPAAVDTAAARRYVHVTNAVLLGYNITSNDLTHATRIIGSAVSGFINLERIGSFDHSAPPVRESWRELVDGLHYQLRNRYERQPGRKDGSP